MVLNDKNTKCFYCECTFNVAHYGTSKPCAKTKDHIIARNKNGNNTPLNMVYACTDCNHLKSNLSLNEFIVRVEALIKKGISYKGIPETRLPLIIKKATQLQEYVLEQGEKLYIGFKGTTKIKINADEDIPKGRHDRKQNNVITGPVGLPEGWSKLRKVRFPKDLNLGIEYDNTIFYNGRRCDPYGKLNADLGFGTTYGQTVFYDKASNKLILSSFGTTIAYNFSDFQKYVSPAKQFPRDNVWEVELYKNTGSQDKPVLEWVKEKRFYHTVKQDSDFDLREVEGLRRNAKHLKRWAPPVINKQSLVREHLDRIAILQHDVAKSEKDTEYEFFLATQTPEQFDLAKRHGWKVAQALTEPQKNFHID